MMTWRYLTSRDLREEMTDTLASMSDGRAGACVTFLGLVRADRHGERQVRALWYEAYEAMADSEIHQLVRDARQRWAITDVAIRHRLGRVAVGELGVLIAVATAHRDDAYAASRFLIEGIKHDVPIWKRECYDDDTTRWVTCGPTERENDAQKQELAHAHV